MSGIELVEAARLAETYGDGNISLATDQNFVLTGVPADRLDDLLAERLLEKYSPDPGPFVRGVVSCTGSEFCRFAVVETKERAVKLARWLDTQLANNDPANNESAVPGRSGNPRIIRMHMSGCSASCAQPQIADIGFRGDVAHVGEQLVEALDIGMGGSLGLDAGFIDWIEHALPADQVPEALLRVIRRYESESREDEPFYNWARRTPADELRSSLAGTRVVPAAGGAA
jgi:ferredoxin-nitrite reductase